MTQPEPATWSVTYPPEPGPEVTAVRDEEGDIWRRYDNGWGWTTRRGETITHPWTDIFEYGLTVTDASHEQEPSDA